MGAAGVDHGGQYWIAENEDGRRGVITPTAASVDGASCVGAAVDSGAESTGARALPVSTGLISLCVLAGHSQRTTGETLAASLVIKLFGLATPLLTQVILDEALMRKSVPTLKCWRRHDRL
jgi:hypothetical protein